MSRVLKSNSDWHQRQQSPMVRPNEDCSKLIYGTENEKTRHMMSELASDTEDTGEWIVKALF